MAKRQPVDPFISELLRMDPDRAQGAADAKPFGNETVADEFGRATRKGRAYQGSGGQKVFTSVDKGGNQRPWAGKKSWISKLDEAIDEAFDAVPGTVKGQGTFEELLTADNLAKVRSADPAAAFNKAITPRFVDPRKAIILRPKAGPLGGVLRPVAGVAKLGKFARFLGTAGALIGIASEASDLYNYAIAQPGRARRAGAELGLGGADVRGLGGELASQEETSRTLDFFDNLSRASDEQDVLSNLGRQGWIQELTRDIRGDLASMSSVYRPTFSELAGQLGI